jgi:hypothetical protein
MRRIALLVPTASAVTAADLRVTLDRLLGEHAVLATNATNLGDFLAGATGLPKLAVRNDLLGHVLELKGQLDAYAKHQYAKAATMYEHAYDDLFMTGDLLAGAIAKQKNLR